jgi:hypothetical protein
VPMRPLPRWLHLLAYLFMSVSAVMSFFVPLASFALVSWKIYIYVWAASLTVGGLVGVLGASLRNLGFELAAITLLLTGYAAYTVILFARGVTLISDHRLAEIPGLVYVLFSTLALCLLLVRRYAELWTIFHHAPRVRGDEK